MCVLMATEHSRRGRMIFIRWVRVIGGPSFFCMCVWVCVWLRVNGECCVISAPWWNNCSSHVQAQCASSDLLIVWVMRSGLELEIRRQASVERSGRRCFLRRDINWSWLAVMKISIKFIWIILLYIHYLLNGNTVVFLFWNYNANDVNT